MKICVFPRVALLVFAPLALQAQTWVGGTNANQTNAAANWSPASIPTANGNLIFDTTAGTNTSVTFNASYTANSLTFSNNATQTYSLGATGGSILTIGAGGLTANSGSNGVNFNSQLNLTLGANQVWSVSSNVSVSSSISGVGFSINKTSTGNLTLSGNNTYGGGTTISGGALYLGQSTSVGNGTISVTSLGTLGVLSSDITISNALSLGGGATLGGSLGSTSKGHLELDGASSVGAGATTLNIAGSEVVVKGDITAASAGANLTVGGTGTGIAVLGGNVTNITTMVASNAGIGFTKTSQIPATLQVTNGGYVSVSDVGNGTTPALSSLLGSISVSDKVTFNGTIGFDTSSELSVPHTYNDNIDLSGFTAGQVSLSSSTTAVLNGTITLPSGATSYDFKGFGGQGGVLVVKSNLANNGATTTGITVTSPNSSGVGNGGQGMVLQGTNTFTGNLSVTQSGVLLDSANALPSKNFSLGANAYVGITENATGNGTNQYTNFADFKNHLQSGYTSSSVLGLDSGAILADMIATGNVTSSARSVSDAINLSGLSSIALGTATGVTIAGGSTIIAPDDGILRLVNFSEKGRQFTIEPVLSSSGNVTSVVVGTTGSDGAVVLKASNTYSGGTTLSGGTLLLGDNASLGTNSLTVTAATSNLTLGAASGSLTVANNITFANSSAGTSTNLQIGNGGFDKQGNFTAGNSTLTLSGAITNPNGGNGRLYINSPTTLSGTNTYSGGTYVLAGTTAASDSALGTFFIDIGKNATLTFSTSSPSVGSISDAGLFLFGFGSGNIILGSGKNLTLTGGPSSSTSSSFSGGIIGGGNITKGGNSFSSLTLTGDNGVQFTGTMTANAGNIIIGDGTTATTTFNSNVVLNGGSLSFRPAAGQNMTYNGTVATTSGTGTVSISGSSTGTMTAGGTGSSFTGNTIVSSGTLNIGGDSAWSSTSNVAVFNGATLQINGNQTLQVGNTTASSGGVGLGTINIAATKTLTLSPVASQSFSGALTGGGNLTKTGAGFTLTLNGTTTSFTGNTLISAGTLQIGSGTSGSLTGNITNNANLVFNRSNASTFAGNISGNGTVSVTGGGGLTLSGANVYTGATSINSGTLFVNGSLGSAVSVVSGATLGGSGSLSGGATLNSGAHLAPGNSPGTLTFTNGLSLLAGAVLDFELGTTSDKILVTGGTLTAPAATNSGLLTLNIVNSGGFTNGTYTLLDFGGTTTNNGLDAGDIALGTVPFGTSSNYSLAIVGTQLQLTATAIPEPGTYAALVGSLALGVAAWRRRQRARTAAKS